MYMAMNEKCPKFTTRYNGVKKVLTVFEKPSLTDQSFKNECDIGFIVENYLRTGRSIPVSTMSYVDCTTVQDYQDAMYLVAEAKSNFENLPSKDRDKFGSVENYLAFISDAKNLKESYEKGYIDPSTVDLSDIYPDTFEKVSDNVSDSAVKELSEVQPPNSES